MMEELGGLQRLTEDAAGYHLGLARSTSLSSPTQVSQLSTFQLSTNQDYSATSYAHLLFVILQARLSNNCQVTEASTLT